MKVVRQYHDCVDREWIAMPGVPERRPQQSDIVGQQRQATVCEIQGEKECAAGNKVTTVSGHGAFWTMGFAPLNPSYDFYARSQGRLNLRLSARPILRRAYT